MAQPSARRPVGGDEDADCHDRGAEIALQHEQHKDARQHGDERDEDTLEVAHPLRVAVDPVGDEDGEGQLAQLRRLEGAEGAGIEPAPRAIHAHPEVGHQDEQHQQGRADCARRGERADAPVVEASQDK